MKHADSGLQLYMLQVVQEALSSLSVGRTVVVVAHRLSTIGSADHIVVLQHGTISEEGTHETLAAANGKYSALLASQY